MHGLLMTTKIMRCFALRLHVVGVGKIPPVRLESGEIMHSRSMKLSRCSTNPQLDSGVEGDPRSRRTGE